MSIMKKIILFKIKIIQNLNNEMFSRKSLGHFVKYCLIQSYSSFFKVFLDLLVGITDL